MRSEDERRLAKQMKDNGKTYQQIADIMQITRSAAQNLLRTLKEHKDKRGRNFILNNKYKLRIKRSINVLKNRREKVNSRKIINTCGLICSKRTVQRHLKREGYKYKAVQRNIKLSMNDRRKRYCSEIGVLGDDPVSGKASSSTRPHKNDIIHNHCFLNDHWLVFFILGPTTTFILSHSRLVFFRFSSINILYYIK